MTPAELLMGRKLRNKIPQVLSQGSMDSEGEHQLRTRDEKYKLKQKEYADRTRSARPSNIEQGDMVLLQKKRDNKLSMYYETDTYQVVQKEGNAVIIQDNNGQQKMRNIGHMKKFIQLNILPEKPVQDTVTEETRPPPAIELPTVPAESPSDAGDLSTSSTKSSQATSGPTEVPVRPSRQRSKPTWMKDCDCVTIVILYMCVIL